MSFDRELFLPVSREDMARRRWDFYDFLLITGDAYVDHPSFGAAIIGRLLEAEGYRVITVTSLQLGSSRHMANVAREVSRCAKRPMRIRSKRFPKSHRSLFALDWSLRTLFKTPDQYENSRDAGKPGKSTAPRPDREY